MAKRKDTPNTPGEQIAQQIFGPIFESMLKGEMENHLGYEKHERVASCDNARTWHGSVRYRIYQSKHTWMQIFDELKARGVQDLRFLSMDGVAGLEDGAKAIFPQVVTQR
ncbi:Transposase, Mutator family [Selenomonas sp. GACV-9]|nr:Transposase, Mutator family [Selenomonas ruminantium]